MISYAQETIHTIYFERNSSKVEPLTNQSLKTYLETTSIDSISIYGYSDYIGNKEHNLILSEKRAQSVFKKLKELNSESLNQHLTNNISVVGLGEIPSPFSTPDGIPKDRKVNIVFHNTPQKYSVNELDKQRYFVAEDGMKFNKTYILDKVYFVGNKPDVIDGSLPQLENLYNQVKQLNSNFKLVIKGHICCLEEDATEDDKAFSRVLSTARALRVKEFLVEKGINETYIDYEGYSFDKPLVFPEITTEDKQKNRRIEVVVYR